MSPPYETMFSQILAAVKQAISQQQNDKVVTAANKVPQTFSPNVTKGVAACGKTSAKPDATSQSPCKFRMPVDSFGKHGPRKGDYPGFLGYEKIATKGPFKGKLVKHNGSDYQVRANTPVYPVKAGTVAYYADNVPGFGGYGKPGPAMWVEHLDKSDKPFFVLYGHMKSAKVKDEDGQPRNLKKGDKVFPDIEIGSIITYENCDHLHLGVYIAPILYGMGLSPDPVAEKWKDPDIWLPENI